MKPVYEKLGAEGAKIPDNAFFMKQKISNACGTFALFHALTQNEKNLDFGLFCLKIKKICPFLGDGPFGKWYAEAKNLSVEDRSDSLANSTSLSEAHEVCAGSGETEATPDVEHHFIAYVNMDGTLYEFGKLLEFFSL
jgi:ubiquitin carboxyl-terminal hydrolase L3